jgi:hypothetical protein
VLTCDRRPRAPELGDQGFLDGRDVGEDEAGSTANELLQEVRGLCRCSGVQGNHWRQIDTESRCQQ